MGLSVWDRLRGKHSTPAPVPPARPPKYVHVSLWSNGAHVSPDGGLLRLDDGKPPIPADSVTDGRLFFTIPGSVSPDFGSYGNGCHVGVVIRDKTVWIDAFLQPDMDLEVQTDFDPSTVPLTELARIRGCMWGVRSNLPYGVRPDRDDNILAMDYFGSEHRDGGPLFNTAQRLKMLEDYTRENYTHAVDGPIQGNDGYHGLYPIWRGEVPSQEQWERFLDSVQQKWNAGIATIYFVRPDGWSFEKTRDVMTPFLTQPRAQRLLRIIVPGGWEPNGGIYDISSYTWAMYGKWIREIMPNALVYLHNAVKADGAPPDAPVGTDEHGDDSTNKSNGEGWRRVAPYYHGWLVQSGPFEQPVGVDPGAREWAAMFNPGGDGATFHGVAWHFANAIDGWPRGSAWGDNEPLHLVSGEQSAYWQYWKNQPYWMAVERGNFAMQHGAKGYLDGGSVPVGTGPCAWDPVRA